jgi:thioredoxin 1
MIQLIDFYADWCGPCQIMKPAFEELKKEYEGRVEFTTDDVEVEGTRSEEFGVMSIPTFVILKDGKEIDRRIGAMPKDEMKRWIETRLA